MKLDPSTIIRVVTTKAQADEVNHVLNELNVPHRVFERRRKNGQWMWAITSDGFILRNDDLGTINRILDKALGSSPEAFSDIWGGS